MKTVTEPCTHCCSTRMLGADPRLWRCEHCCELLKWDSTPAPAEWVAESFPQGTAHLRPHDPDRSVCRQFKAIHAERDVLLRAARDHEEASRA